MADSSNSNEQNSADALDDACMDSWRAYSDMYDSKQRHYELLQILEDKKKKFNISPSAKDQQQLALLLEQHDAKVKQFIALTAELKVQHPDSHANLFKFIGQLGDGEPTKNVKH